MKSTIGAEAVITLENGIVRKERLPKAYRHPALDSELRRSRTRREAKIMGKPPILAPKLLSTDRESVIEMEFIDGTPLKHLLDAEPAWAEQVGKHLAKLHDAAIIHGDLTTSNMLVKEDLLYFIDFGLSFSSHDAEDKAVDIHLFRQALESKHHTVHEQAYRHFLNGYRSSKRSERTLERLKVVERRGKNKAKW